MEEKMNLVQKLAKIRSMADVISKDKKGFNYKYEDVVQILAKITAGMKKYGVSLIPMIVPGSAKASQMIATNTKVDKQGKPYENTVTEMLVTADMVFKWVNEDDPSDYIEVPWFVTGMQSDPSQAFGSGLTYCTRYFMTNYFQMAKMETDVDEYRSKQKEAEAAESKMIAGEIIGNFDKVVNEFLARNPDKSDDVKKFVSKYVKNANYFAIKEPNLASKLMNDFRKNFIEGA